MVSYQGNALCQAMKLEGMSSGSERRLEDRIGHLISHNGVEFVVETLKLMKQHCIDNLDNPSPFSQEKYGHPYISWNHKLDRPKGGLGVIYTEFPDVKKRLRVIGAAINTFELDEPSVKQKERFLSGVEYNQRTSGDERAILTNDEVIRLRFALKDYLALHKPFDGTQMTGAVVPEGLEQNGIAVHKRKLSRELAQIQKQRRLHNRDARSLAIASMEAATVNQVYLAPKVVHDYVRDYIVKPRSEERRKGYVYLKRPTPVKARPYDGNTKFGLHIEEYRPYVGTISMLQQPGAKLRTVVNVNRYVNYAMEPFAKAMEKAFYGYPQVAVLNQEDGMAWAQQQLAAGRKLASIDLSQATDLLDYRVFVRAITNSDFSSPELNATLETFSYIAESPFYQPELGIGVTMNTGQPLGLKGSFQMLTAMNFAAGRQACLEVGLKDLPFRVVGDDMIIDDRAAERYSEIISNWSGKTNYEKMLTSDRHAEFCSHIITREQVVSMKPKYIAGYTNVYKNAEKTSLEKVTNVYKLTAQDKAYLTAIAECGDPRYGNLPFVQYSNRMAARERQILSEAKELYTSLGQIEGSHIVTVKAETVDLALQEHPEVYTRKRRELDRTRYIRTPQGEVHLAPSSVFDEDRRFNPVVDRYNHKTGEREEKQRQTLKSARKEAKVIKALVDDLKYGKPSELPIPGHESTVTVSTTALLVNAIDKVQHDQQVLEANAAVAQAITSNEIPGMTEKNIVGTESLSDEQLLARMEQAMRNAGLLSQDRDHEVDYHSYLP